MPKQPVKVDFKKNPLAINLCKGIFFAAKNYALFWHGC